MTGEILDPRNIEFERSKELLQDPNSVAIINLGSQHTGEIRDQVQALGLRGVIIPVEMARAADLQTCGAVILSGGSHSVNNESMPVVDPEIFELEKPMYGICLGAQLMAKKYGGRVESSLGSEFAQHAIIKTKQAKNHSEGVFASKGKSEKVWMNHGDRITVVPKGFRTVAESEGGVVAAIMSEDKMRIGVQFHPEVTGEDRTFYGNDLFAGFLFDIAKLTPTYETETLEQQIENLRNQVGDHDVMLFLSGGVDSAVLLELMTQATDPKKIHAVHVDNGFMREGEIDEVAERFKDKGVNFYVEDAKEFFLDAQTEIDGKLSKPLRDEYDPQRKRVIIGDAFMQYSVVVAKRLGLPDNFLLAQGTIRPDMIESGSHDTVTIKTHHNDSPLARAKRARGELLEPLKELYKPGVRALGRTLGMPEDIIMRQPFPGPGLAVRTLCTPPRPVITRAEMLNLWQGTRLDVDNRYGVSVLPVRSVGQRGDDRSYGLPVALSGPEKWEELFEYARTLPQKHSDITRVVYSFGNRIDKAIGIRRADTRLDDGSVDLLRCKADKIARDVMRLAGLDHKLSQVPVVLLPTGIDKLRQHSVVIRTFLTTNFMTGTPAMPGTELMPLEVLHDMVDRILAIDGIAHVLYDMTSKPPGTTEWE